MISVHMDAKVSLDLIRLSLPVIERWCNRFSTSREFLSPGKSGKSLFSLVVCGGMALNCHLAKPNPTRDLDLKLVYNRPIAQGDFWHHCVNVFNPLRTRIMLEIKRELNGYIASNRELFDNLQPFIEEPCECLTVGINYKYPYLIYGQRDSLKCAARYPNMVHMVYSILYHAKGEENPTSLIDLSMFLNINNPDHLNGRTLENGLYLDWSDTSGHGTGNVVPFVYVKLNDCRVRVAAIGFVLCDLHWLSFLHHKEEKREASKQKMQLLIDELPSGMREQLSPFLTTDPRNQNSADRELLLRQLRLMSLQQINGKIPVYNYWEVGTPVEHL